MQTRGRRRRSGAGAGAGDGDGDGDGDGRIDASLGDTPRGSRSVRSPSPRRRAPRVNEDRLLSAEERDRDSVAQILERSQHILHSILSTEEAQAFLDGVGLGVEYMNNFAQLLKTRIMDHGSARPAAVKIQNTPRLSLSLSQISRDPAMGPTAGF